MIPTFPSKKINPHSRISSLTLEWLPRYNSFGCLYVFTRSSGIHTGKHVWGPVHDISSNDNLKVGVIFQKYDFIERHSVLILRSLQNLIYLNLIHLWTTPDYSNRPNKLKPPSMAHNVQLSSINNRRRYKSILMWCSKHINPSSKMYPAQCAYFSSVKSERGYIFA